MKKTYIVLPFKDKNGKYKTALNSFIDTFFNYVETQLSNFEIIIVEQLDGSINTNLPHRYSSLARHKDEEFFNLGRTINIGFDIIKNNNDVKDDDILFFHPVDLLPKNVNYNIINTTKFFESIHPSENYYHYKLIGFKISDFETVNGFSNEYWGWGLEDDDMIHRLKFCDITCDMIGYDYERLCVDGNDDAPLFNQNFDILNEFKNSRNCYNSGLNTLNYEIVKIEIVYDKIKKYIIK